jgi:phospholipid-binding lipoprotein MlaA
MTLWPTIRAALALSLAVLLSGCATTGKDPRDPWEDYNRQITDINIALDENLLEPVAKGYQAVFPGLVRAGVSNFFGNLTDVWSTANNLLQAKPRETSESLFRVSINSTLGLFGLIDVATELNIPRHKEDFGQTLGHWGVPLGPYLVLPVFGPSTLRDAVALPVDWKGDLLNIHDIAVQSPLSVLRLVDKRANYLGAGNVLDAVALDKYTFIREAYLQLRRGSQPSNKPAEPEERYDLPAPGTPAVPLVPAPSSAPARPGTAAP